MQDEEEQAEEEQTIIVPAEALPPEPEVEEEKEPDELADLFEVPQPEDNDMRTDIALDLDEEDIMGGDPDMSDLVDVPDEVFTGAPPASEPEKVKRPVRRVRLIRRRPPTPPTSIQGVGY